MKAETIQGYADIRVSQDEIEMFDFLAGYLTMIAEQYAKEDNERGVSGALGAADKLDEIAKRARKVRVIT